MLMPYARVRHLHTFIAEQLEVGFDPTTVNYDLSRRSRGVPGRQPRAVREAPEGRAAAVADPDPGEVFAVSQEFTDERARLIFRTAVLTGLRRHELQNLLGSEIDFVDSRSRVRESKSDHGRRTVALPPALREDL
jgi:integrase